ADDGEDDVVRRGGRRWVARITRHGTALAEREWQPLPSARPAQCYIERRGAVSGLAVRPMDMPVPGDGEVVIRMRAGGLNFRDVANAVGMRDDDGSLGLEGAGIVAAVGPGVHGVAVGDPVVAAGFGSFATYLRTSAALVAP